LHTNFVGVLTLYYYYSTPPNKTRIIIIIIMFGMGQYEKVGDSAKVL